MNTCIVQGRLIRAGFAAPDTSILLDTGAAFNCLSSTFHKRYFGKILPQISKNRLAFDASGRAMSINGEIKLNVTLDGPDGILHVNDVIFTILENITQEVILGCNTLALLGMKVTIDSVLLKQMSFNRLVQPKHEILTLHLGTVLRIKDAIVVRWPDNQATTICTVVPDNSFSASVRSGAYSVELMDDLMAQLGVPYNSLNGHSLSPTLEVKQSGLSALWTLTFRHEIREIPNEIQCAWVPLGGKQNSQINNINKQAVSRPELTKEQINKMLQGTQLPRGNIFALILRFRHIFACNDNDLGCYQHPVSLRLRDPSKTPAYTKPRVVPYRLRPWLDEKLQAMVETGLIAVAKESEFCSPIHIVKKKEAGKYRLTIDYRLLNDMLIQNRWPIPNIRSVLEELSGSNFYSVCDCRSGFWQLALDEKSQKLTAFAARDRLYQWKVLPMGLSVSPGIFQSIMMDALGEDIHRTCLIYIDDLLIYTRTAEDHLAAVERIFKKLWQAGIRLHPDKSHFGVAKVEFLGYEVSRKGYLPLPSKVESILAMDRPMNKTALKSFIGSVAYYTQSLPMLQNILGPLHAITGSKSVYNWTSEQETAFEEAKQVLASCGPLAFPDKSGKCQLYLTTDSSDEGYGGVLSEKQPDGIERPLGYFSGSYRHSSLNWAILEKELYAFYFGLSYFYAQLMAADFTWRTDNKGLSTLTTNTNLKMKANGAPNSRVIRWLEYITQFQFTIELRKGDSPEMGLADCLSRFKRKKADSNSLETDQTNRNTDMDTAQVNVITEERLRLPYWTKVGCPLIDFISEQLNDADLVQLTGEWFKYTKGKRKATFRISPEGVREIRLRKQGFKAMVPKTLVQKIFDYYHLKSHNSLKKMMPEIGQALFIPSLQRKLRKYINKCPVCLAINYRPPTDRMPVKTNTSHHPWANLQADLMGPLPLSLRQNRYILAMVCEATNWLELRGLKDKSAETVLEAINEIFATKGPPLNLQTDGGREFVNEKLESYLKDLGIYHNRICPYKPSSNGRIEGCMKRIQRQMKLLKVTELNWDEALPAIQLALNWGRQAGGYSPWMLFHGWVLHRPAFLPGEFDPDNHEKYLTTESEWAKSQIVRMARLISDEFMAKEGRKLAELDRKAPKPETLEIGMKVLIHFPSLPKSKLFARWKHLYVIKEKIDLNTYIVSEEGQSRKRYIVDRRRIRPLGEKLSAQDFEEIGQDELEILDETADIPSSGRNDRNIEHNDQTMGTEPVPTLDIAAEQSPSAPATQTESIKDPEVRVAIGTTSTGGAMGFAEIEFDVPEDATPPPEEDRPRRKAAAKAQTRIKGWTKTLLEKT